MKRFARIAAPLGAAVVALVLAIARLGDNLQGGQD